MERIGQLWPRFWPFGRPPGRSTGWLPAWEAGFLPFRATAEEAGYAVYFDGRQKTALAICQGREDLLVDYAAMEAWIGGRKTPYAVHLVRRRIYVDAAYFAQAGFPVSG